jgi:hypothetical protein
MDLQDHFSGFSHGVRKNRLTALKTGTLLLLSFKANDGEKSGDLLHSHDK